MKRFVCAIILLAVTICAAVLLTLRTSSLANDLELLVDSPAKSEENIDIPEPDTLDNYSGQFKLRMPKSLHKSLANHALREGISMNQYCLYLLSKNDGLSLK